MSLEIKYRPKTLDEVFGNSAIKKVISLTKKFSPILFEGLRGSGKTTLAYIVSKLFGADDLNISRVNCFAEGVDAMRIRLDDMKKTSLFGKKKVLILDEIHGLSKQAQQIFLTPLEELDQDSLIIACTTTTEAVNPALLDRFKRFKVLPLSDLDAKALLKTIIEKEKMSIPKWKLVLLIEKCNGIPRLLLNGLEKIKDVDDEKEVLFLLTLNELEEENTEVVELFKLILAKVGWDIIKTKLQTLLKEMTPESIRVGLCNITAARLMSNYGSLEEKIRLSKLYDIYLRAPISYPEKSNIINIIFQLSR